MLIGLQLPRVLDELSDRAPGELLFYGVAVSAVVIAMRIAWVFGQVESQCG